MKRAQGDELLKELSGRLFSDQCEIGYGKFTNNAGYMSLSYDRTIIERLMRVHGAKVLDTFEDSLAELTDEIVRDSLGGGTALITTVKELIWVMAFGGHIFANLHLSSRGKDLIPSPPSISLVKNVDTRALQVKRINIGGSFEQIDKLDMSKVVVERIEPGETFYVDGFKDLLWYDESGVLLLSLTTLPLGAYDAVYSQSDGSRIGVFSSDLRHSSTVVALRCFAASGWNGARDLAIRSSSHSLREIRWAALNYFWRTAAESICDDLARFVDDKDPEIRNLAKACLNSVIQGKTAYAS